MRNVLRTASAGCLFFCLGGWGYNVWANQADTNTFSHALADAASRSLLAKSPNTAGAAANAPTLTAVDSARTMPRDARPATAKTARPAATRPAPTTNLKKAHVHVSGAGLVEMHVENMDIATILNLLSRQGRMNIIASRGVTGKVSVDLYDVSFYQALRAILTPNGFGYIKKGNFIYVYTTKELADIAKAEYKPVNHIFRLQYIDAADAASLIKPLESASGVIAMTPAAQTALLSSGSTGSGGGGGSSTGGSTSGGSPGSSAGEAYSTEDILVVHDYPRNIANIAAALKELDVRPKQVLIACTVLSDALTDSNDMGVDLVSLSGVDFSSLTSAKLTNNTTDSVYNGFQQGAVPQPGKAQAVAGTNFASQVPDGGLSVGFLSDNVNVFVRALEQVSSTTVVANPKVLALNKQVADIHVGQNIGYRTATTTATATTSSVSFLSVGTELSFRPFIESDGYIRMDIQPTISSGFIDSLGIPQETTTTVTSNLMVKDGRTVVLGGLIQESDSGSKGQVPVLGDIPVFGIPFRNTNDSITRTETIFLITPHVINDNTALYHDSQKQEHNVRLMMLGNRAGLQPWSEDRLAQIWYVDARRALRRGDRKKALMYVNWSLNTEPNFINAIRLREKLTHQEIEGVDAGSIRGFVRTMIRQDRGNGNARGGPGDYPPPQNINTRDRRKLTVPGGAP